MKDIDYRMLQYISQNYDLIVDTREQINPRYEARKESFQRMNLTPVRRKLFAGDYSAIAKTPHGTIDYTERIAIERKLDATELVSCLNGPNRPRFEAELKRAHNNGCRLYIVTEGSSYADLAAGNYRNDVDPRLVLATYHAFEQRYGCQFVFVPQGCFPIFVHETLRRFIMDDLMVKFKAGEIKLS